MSLISYRFEAHDAIRIVVLRHGQEKRTRTAVGGHGGRVLRDGQFDRKRLVVFGHVVVYHFERRRLLRVAVAEKEILRRTDEIGFGSRFLYLGEEFEFGG